MSRIRLIAIDIGGTLIDEQNKIPKETIKLLNTLCDNGIVIALITARMYSSTKYISNLIGAKYGVFGNGSNVINIVDKCDIYSETFDYNTLKKLINFGKKERLYTHLNEKYFEMSDEKKYFTLKHLILNKDYPEELKSNIKIVKDLYK